MAINYNNSFVRFSLPHKLSPKVSLEYICSNGQGYWVVTEVDRNHEALKFFDQAASNQPDNARDEHGDDEGMPFICYETALGHDILDILLR